MEFYNSEFDESLEPSQSSRWNDIVELTHFADIDEFWQWSSDLDGKSVFWHLEPFPGAVEALGDLNSDGHELVILTAKPPFAREDTYAWIERYSLPVQEVHILEEKWQINCDVYLDDGPHVLPDLVKHRPDRVVCRYVRPWNVPVVGAVDVRDFGEFRDLVSSLT